MEKYSRKLLQNIYISLPQKLKEAIFSIDNAEKIQQIAQRYQVPAQKVPHLARTTGRVLLTVLAIEKLISSLEVELNIDRNAAERIARDIKQEIIQPVMATLTRIQQESSQKPTPKSIPKTTSSRPPTTPGPRNENIVDLKNLPKE